MPINSFVFHGHRKHAVRNYFCLNNNVTKIVYQTSIVEVNSLLTQLFRTIIEEKKYPSITRHNFVSRHILTPLEVCVQSEILLSFEVLLNCSQPKNNKIS